MEQLHHYNAVINWTGNTGNGTLDYNSYSRNHSIAIENKPVINGSSDPAFRGDPGRHNPEDMFLSSIAACHMLWYLHLCADAGVVVLAYTDHAFGCMVVSGSGEGKFIEVVLRPLVTVKEHGMIKAAGQLHAKAHTCCFIANSVNFPVHHMPVIKVD